MVSAKIITTVIFAVLGTGAFLKTSHAFPAPDSAGIVEMVNGLAYGGIPYGSVSGMLSSYSPSQKQAVYQYNSVQQPSLLVAETRIARANPAVGY